MISIPVLFSALSTLAGSHAVLTTPQIDSTAKIADSIYALAVDPAGHPNDNTVLLLDGGWYSVEPDGRTKRTTRQVVQILKEEGTYPYREMSFSYEPDRERLTVNWIRVVKPNGEVVSDHPLQSQESDIPASMGTPTYVSRKIKRMSLSGVEPGNIVDVSTTTEDLKPPMPGNFQLSWRITTGVPVERSYLAVDVPSGFAPRISENRVSFRRTEKSTNGRKTYIWAAHKVEPIKFQGLAPDSIQQASTVRITAPFDWAAVGKWWSTQIGSAYTITPMVADKLATVVAGSRTLDDSVRAVHRWVAQDIRYVAIELGRGGYVPRDPETVVRTGFGDCKDKAMLFLAALRRMGVTGYPVLLNAFAPVQRSMPALEAFNHVIAAVRRGSGYVFADLTASPYPLGTLPRSEEGKFGLIVKDNGVEEITFPQNAPGASRAETRIVGELTDSGVFNGHYEELRTGPDAAFMRSAFSTPLDSARRANLARAIANGYFEGAEGDSLSVFDGKDYTVPVHATLRIRNAKVVTQAGSVLLLNNPLHPLLGYARQAKDLERDPKRTLPIDVSKIVQPTATMIEVKMKLPSGWKAVLPKNISASGPLGSYEERYSQNGDVLTISKSTQGARGELPPDRLPEVIAWLKMLGNEDSKLIVLQKQ